MKAVWMMAGLLAAGALGAAEPIDERRTVADDVTIVIKNVKGEVNVRAGAPGEVRLTGSLGEGTRGLEVSDGGSRLSIEVKFPRNGHDVEDTELDLEVPVGASLEIEVVSADVLVNGVSGQRIQVNSVSGEVEVRADAEQVALKTVSGDIAIRTRSTRIELESVSGDIEGDDLTGELTITTVSGEALISTVKAERAHFESVSGDLELDLDMAPGANINIASLSGDVDLAFAAELSAEVEVTSFSGSIRSDRGDVQSARHGPQKRLNFRAGDGSARVSIESFSGDVRIRSR